MRHAGAAVAALAAVALSTAGIVRGTHAVGGSDSSCYALMAEAFARGTLQPVLPLAERAPWPNATLTFAPGGFIPSPVRPAAASPVCAPGFSLLMTLFRSVGGREGIFLVTPVFAAVLVWCGFVVARRLGGDAAGAVAAVALATSPIVLFQTVQPMNDITTAALWTAVLAAASVDDSRRYWAMGALTGIAVLVRPNLAPVAAVVGVWVCARAVRTGRRWGVVAFSLAAVPGVVAVLFLNWRLYGHPIGSGYGTASELFSVQYIGTNFNRYSRAFLETQTPFPLLALAAPFVAAREHRPLIWLALGIAAVTVASYIAYRPHDEWWYLRFLLPAIAVLIALASAVLARLVRRKALAGVIAIALAAFGAITARDRQAFDLQRLESRFARTGEVVRSRLSSDAILLTVWQSGSVRFHANREAVLWDSLPPAFFDAALEWLQDHGYEPFILLERWEEPLFRQRLGGESPLGKLDWPPRFEIDRQVRIYAPADRDLYLAGQPVPTEYVWSRR